MLRALFLLFFVGGALYAGLAATHSALTGDTGDDSSEYSYVLAIRSPASETVAVPLRSWGANLQSLRNEPQRSVPASQPVADRDNRPASAALAVAASSSEGEEAIGWARVALAARAHGDASVSSPTIHFYRAGAELEIVGRDGAWLKLRDPATKEEGWVFEQYVSLMDRPRATQVVAAAPKDHATSVHSRDGSVCAQAQGRQECKGQEAGPIPEAFGNARARSGNTRSEAWTIGFARRTAWTWTLPVRPPHGKGRGGRARGYALGLRASSEETR